MSKKNNAETSSFDKADKTRLKTLLKSLRDTLITGYANYLDYSNPSGKDTNINTAVERIDESIVLINQALKYAHGNHSNGAVVDTHVDNQLKDDPWWITNEIKEYCRKATESDKTNIYQPMMRQGWKLVVKPKPGSKGKAFTTDFKHPFLLLKMVEFLSVASRLYPDTPIGNDPQKMANVISEIAKLEAKKTKNERDWEIMVMNWTPEY